MSNIEKKVPDKLDKFRKHLFENAKLKESEELMLSKYRRAVAFLSAGYNKSQTVKALEKEFEADKLSESHAYAIMREACLLFGEVAKVDKEGLRHIKHERFVALSKMAEKDGDVGAAIRAEENAAKLYGLFDYNPLQVDPAKFLVPATIIFSSDPDVLKKQQTIDIPHEDI